MLNTAFHRESLNSVYLALQTTKLSDLLTLVRELPLAGLSVTMPLKQEILQAPGKYRSCLRANRRLQYHRAGPGWKALRL